MICALMQQNYAAAVDESGIDIVSRPTVDVVQIEKGKPFILTAEVAVPSTGSESALNPQASLLIEDKRKLKDG